MIVHSEVLGASRGKHRRLLLSQIERRFAENMSLAKCEGIRWPTLNCTDRCPRHWPIGYSAHGRHRSDRED